MVLTILWNVGDQGMVVNFGDDGFSIKVWTFGHWKFENAKSNFDKILISIKIVIFLCGLYVIGFIQIFAK